MDKRSPLPVLLPLSAALALPGSASAQFRGRAAAADVPVITLPGMLPSVGEGAAPTLSVSPGFAAAPAAAQVAVPLPSLAPAVVPVRPAVVAAGFAADVAAAPVFAAAPAAAQIAVESPFVVGRSAGLSRAVPVSQPFLRDGSLVSVQRVAETVPTARRGRDAGFVQKSGTLFEGRGTLRGALPGVSELPVPAGEFSPRRLGSLLRAPRRAGESPEEQGRRPPAPTQPEEKPMGGWEAAFTVLALLALAAGGIAVGYLLIDSFAQMAAQFEWNLRNYPGPFDPF